MFELDNKNFKRILIIITYSILLCFAIIKYEALFMALKNIISLLKPFIFGFCIAFVLNIPLCKFENIIYSFLSKMAKKKDSKSNKKIVVNNKVIRIIGIIISLLIFMGIFLITTLLVIPEFINTIVMFKESIPTAFNTCKEWLINLMNNYPNVVEKIKEITPNWQELDASSTEFMKNMASGLIGMSIEFVVSFFTSVINFLIGIVFAIYMLIQKDKLCLQLKKVFNAYIPKDICKNIFHIGDIANDTFKKFFGGQFIEAILLGVLCFIGMQVLKIPYQLTISVLVGVTALIPVFGSFFGTGIGAILILAIDPTKAIWFVVMILVIQQIDNNLFYPRIVGNSVGLPGIWVMLAVLVFGNAFGIVGMLVGVPITSIVYKLVAEYVSKKENETVVEKSKWDIQLKDEK